MKITAEGTIYMHSDTQKYEVLSWEIDNPDSSEAGHINLQDLSSGDIERYAIWLGNEDLSFYYVCLHNEDEEEYDVVNIEAFGIHVFTFTNLSQEARIVAAIQFAAISRKAGRSISVQNAYRILRRENLKRLFDVEGNPAWHV